MYVYGSKDRLTAPNGKRGEKRRRLKNNSVYIPYGQVDINVKSGIKDETLTIVTILLQLVKLQAFLIFF